MTQDASKVEISFTAAHISKETPLLSPPSLRILDRDPTENPKDFPSYQGLEKETTFVQESLKSPIVEGGDYEGLVRPFQNAWERPVSVLFRPLVEEALLKYAPANLEQQRILKMNFGLSDLDGQFKSHQRLGVIIEQVVLHDRLLSRLETAAVGERSGLEHDLSKVQADLGLELSLLGQEIQPYLDSVYEKLRPFFEEAERITFLLKKEFGQILGEEEVEKRVGSLWEKTFILPAHDYEGHCLCQKVDSKVVPGFVGDGSFNDGVDRIFAVATEEALEYLAEVWNHEAVHFMGPPNKRMVYDQPIIDEVGLVTTERIERHMGPLWIEYRDLFPLDEVVGLLETEQITRERLISSGVYRSWAESQDKRNFEEGEWRTWEAITDWQAGEIFSQIHPGYQFKSGYVEKSLISFVVQGAGKRNSEIRMAIKKALILGNREIFIQVLDSVFGEGDHYRFLVSFIHKYEELQNARNKDRMSMDEFKRRAWGEVFLPVREHFTEH